jgi:hypothetical protein
MLFPNPKKQLAGAFKDPKIETIKEEQKEFGEGPGMGVGLQGARGLHPDQMM